MEKLEKLGKYEIRRELGRGAMGVVYEAFDPLIERTVAIKTILKSAIDKREAAETFSRFRREARAAGRLSHPKIVSIYEYGEDDDMAFIVMELIHGKELKDYFDHEDRFTIRDSIRIVMQILDALDFSHSRGVVHRDIKPANILITDDGQIKIADFGIAKIDSSRLTQVGVVLGTPTYMSPEQFMGHEVDHRTDIYATGVILYQFLAGKRPFTGSVITVMHQAINQEATPPSHLNPDVSKQLDEVVKKAMAKQPEDRFQSATEFMQALKAAAQASPAPEYPGTDPDSTLVDAHKAFPSDETIVLPIKADSTDVRRATDIEAWQRITNSQKTADFNRYLQDFPSGEFTELAQMRIAALENLATQALAAEEQTRLKQEAKVRAALDEKKRKEAEQRETLEREQAQAKALAEAEAKRQRDAAERIRLASQLAVIKNEAEVARSVNAVKREKEAVEHVQRAKELSVTISERARKFEEVVLEREAATDAERSMKMEARRKLEEEVQRKKQAKMQLLLKREAAANESETDAEEKHQRETAESVVRNKELAEAKDLVEVADHARKRAEERAILAHKQTRFWIVTVGTVLAVLLTGILIALLYSSK